MSAKKSGRAGGFPPARAGTESRTQPEVKPGELQAEPVDISTQDSSPDDTETRDTKTMPIQGLRTDTPSEGVAVIGEAVRRTPPERAEFLIEVTATAMTTGQSLRDNHLKTAQITQAIGSLGVQPGDLQTISLKVQSLYSPVMQQMIQPMLPPMLQPMLQQPMTPYAGSPQAAPGAFPQHAGGVQPIPQEIQFGTYHATNLLRVSVRDLSRVGEIVDAAARAGGTLTGSVNFRAADESGVRKATLEAAGIDARKKAEALATAAGKQLGDPIAITEDILATNGTLMALRATMPFAFGAGAPEVAGELEYYARVSASFRFL